MSQISPPIRIVLVAVIGLMAAWMLFLRPKTEATPAPAPAPATAPGVTGLKNAVDGAKEAGAAQEARDGKVQKATGEAGSAKGSATGAANAAKPGTAAPAETAAVKALPKPVRAALNDNKILVLAFFTPKSADDRAVRRELKSVSRWSGEVVVETADVARVSRYAVITRGADVDQSPSIVVVDRNEKARTLVGFQDSLAIDQAVVDAMRGSGGLIKDRYLRAVNDVCRTYGQSVWTVPTATSSGTEFETMLARYERGSARLLTKFKAVPAPKRWRAFKRASVADVTAIHQINRGLGAKVGDGSSPAAVTSALTTYGPRVETLSARWNARMDKHNVLSCGTNY